MLGNSKKHEEESKILSRKSSLDLFRAGHALSIARDKLKEEKKWCEWQEKNDLPRSSVLEAIKLYEKTARDNPDDTVAFYNLGFHYHIAGLLQDALNAYVRAVELDPTNAQALNNIAAIYHASGNRTEALKFYTRAIEADPEYLDVYGNRALLYYEIKEYNKGREEKERRQVEEAF